jgi:putative ABC transport system ATP-binding protein
MDVFQYLNRERGITVAVVTHEPDIAQYTNRVIVFKDGRIKRDYVVEKPRSAKQELASLPPVIEDDDEDDEDEGE